MIHEFRNPVPVKTEIGYGWLMYVRDGGTFANDVFAVVMEKDGGIRHFRTEQFSLLPNPTCDIESDGEDGAEKEGPIHRMRHSRIAKIFMKMLGGRG